MSHWTRRIIAGSVVLTLLGCESAVLVNNRPDRGTDLNNPADQSQTASARIDADADNQDEAVTAAATTQPSSDQRVNTKNVEINSPD